MIQNIKTTDKAETFGYYISQWLESKKGKCCAGTFGSYRSCAKYLAPLYESPIADLSAWEFEVFFRETARTHDIAYKTLYTIRQVAKGAYDIWIKSAPARVSMGRTNIIAYVELPEGTRNLRQPITEEQIRWIVESSHEMQLAAMIGVFAGLRRGEVLALDPTTDFFYGGNAIRVNKTIIYTNGVPHLKHRTKTAAGDRIVCVPDILAEYLARQNLNRHILLPSTNGNYYCDSRWQRRWWDYQKELNIRYGYHVMPWEREYTLLKSQPKLLWKIKPFTFHQLRHTYATMLYNSHVDAKTAQMQLGHSKIDVTMDIYTHLDRHNQNWNLQVFNTYANQYRQKPTQKFA